MEHNPVMTSSIIRETTNPLGKCNLESREKETSMSLVKNDYFTTDQSPEYTPPRTDTRYSQKIQTTKDMLKLSGYSLYEPYQTDGLNWLISRERPSSMKKLTTKCFNCDGKCLLETVDKCTHCHTVLCKSCISNRNFCPECNCEIELQENKVYGGLLCDEMGLGKTIQMISLMLANPVNRTLIILPTNLIRQWEQEIKKIAPTLNVLIHYGNSRLNNFASKRNIVVLTSYGLISRNGILNGISWDRLILDEAHIIRNPKSTIYKTILKLSCVNRWCITGTPIQNYKTDLRTLLKFIGVNMPKRVNDEKYLEYIDTYILKRTKKSVETFNHNLKLPQLEIMDVELDFKSKEEKNLYSRLLGDYKDKTLDYRFGDVYIFELVQRLRQSLIFPQMVLDGYSKKFDISYEDWSHTNTKLDYLLEQDLPKNTIIFTQYRKETQYIYDGLINKGYDVDYINGSRTYKQKNQIIEKVPDVLLLQINSCCTGLNLQDYNTIYFTSLHYNPALHLQAIARAHRIGQKSEVKVYNLIIKETIDTRVRDIITNKIEMYI